MVLYSVTVNVADEVHEEWLQWMREVHVPDVMNTGCFVSNKIMRLKDPIQDGNTYSFQYFAETDALLTQYLEVYAPALRADVDSKFANQYLAFRTILDVIE
ncbi:MAG: DUF4286 family protein [Sphingobacteriales bacterium]|jgi:hypothetical protein|nr:DUF4286 family protein [Sphingobacteriales bacterium]